MRVQSQSLRCWPAAGSRCPCMGRAPPPAPTCMLMTWRRLLTSCCTRWVAGRSRGPTRGHQRAHHAAQQAPTLHPPTTILPQPSPQHWQADVCFKTANQTSPCRAAWGRSTTSAPSASGACSRWPPMCAPCSSWRQRSASWRLCGTAPSTTAGEAGCGAWQPRLPLLPLPLLVCAGQKRRLLPTTQQLLDHLCTCPPALPAPWYCRYCLGTAGTSSATPSWQSWAGRSAPPGRWASGRLWTGISRMLQPTGTAVSEWARGGKPASVARICAGCRPAPLLAVTALLLTRCCCWCCPATTLTLPCRSLCGGSAGGAPPCSASTAGGSTGLGLVEPPSAALPHTRHTQRIELAYLHCIVELNVAGSPRLQGIRGVSHGSRKVDIAQGWGTGNRQCN